MEKIGITTTVPVEVILAGGCVPVDINNIFITHPDPSRLVSQAEEEGLPRNLCSWVKGIYAVLCQNPQIKTVIAVTQGDCTNTLSMLDLLRHRGVEVIPFAYPYSRKREELDREIRRLESVFGICRPQTEEMKIKLDEVRQKALRIDEMTYKENLVTGFENHLFLISCSDFMGNPDEYRSKAEEFIQTALKREPLQQRIRLGYCGVPPIFSDLYHYLEEMNARVVYNEMQRQFAMPDKGEDIVSQYLNYTYPYYYIHRVSDINKEIPKRRLDGVIHYIQSFCHHQIHDRQLKESLQSPVITIEGDRPGRVQERLRIRMESFLETLQFRNPQGQNYPPLL